MYIYYLCEGVFLRYSHAEARFSFERTAYTVCENGRLTVNVILATTGVLDRRVLVDVRVIGGTATSTYNIT